jgi:hypothetical protein
MVILWPSSVKLLVQNLKASQHMRRNTWLLFWLSNNGGLICSMGSFSFSQTKRVLLSSLNKGSTLIGSKRCSLNS